MTRVDLLTAGYTGDRVASSICLMRDEDVVIVSDPGMVAHRRGPGGERRAGPRESSTANPDPREASAIDVVERIAAPGDRRSGARPGSDSDPGMGCLTVGRRAQLPTRAA